MLRCRPGPMLPLFWSRRLVLVCSNGHPDPVGGICTYVCSLCLQVSSSGFVTPSSHFQVVKSLNQCASEGVRRPQIEASGVWWCWQAAVWHQRLTVSSEGWVGRATDSRGCWWTSTIGIQRVK